MRSLALGVGILLTMIPVTLIVTVLKELVSLRFAVDLFWSHAFMSASLIGAIVFSPLAGLWIDRSHNRRRLIGIALAGNGLCFAVMAVAPTFPIFMGARIVEGAMHITALSAWLATAADASPEGRSGRVMGTLGGMLMLGITIGVPLGGVIAKAGAEMVLWSAAGISVVTGIYALFVVSGGPRRRESLDLGEFWLTIKGNPWLLIPYAYSFIDRLCIGVVVTTLGLYMSDVLGLTPAGRGLQLSMFLLPFALLSYPAGRLVDRVGRVTMMAVGSICFGLVFMTYGYVAGWSLTAVMVLSGVFSAAMFVPTLALAKDLALRGGTGTAFAGYNVAGSLGFVVGPLVGGAIFAAVSSGHPLLDAYRWTFIITGGFEILCALVSLPFLLRLRRRGHSR